MGSDTLKYILQKVTVKHESHINFTTIRQNIIHVNPPPPPRTAGTTFGVGGMLNTKESVSPPALRGDIHFIHLSLL